jgi:uncharacterized FlaG/YvyC family protein
MASDGIPVNIPVTRLVQGSRARTSDSVKGQSGNPLPPGGEAAPADHATQAAREIKKAPVPDIPALVAQLNKRLNLSGRPDQFRLDSTFGRRVIQQVNPDNGEIIAEYPEALFPTLAQGLSGAGLLIDTKA